MLFDVSRFSRLINFLLMLINRWFSRMINFLLVLINRWVKLDMRVFFFVGWSFLLIWWGCCSITMRTVWRFLQFIYGLWIAMFFFPVSIVMGRFVVDRCFFLVTMQRVCMFVRRCPIGLQCMMFFSSMGWWGIRIFLFICRYRMGFLLVCYFVVGTSIITIRRFFFGYRSWIGILFFVYGWRIWILFSFVRCRCKCVLLLFVFMVFVRRFSLLIPVIRIVLFVITTWSRFMKRFFLITVCGPDVSIPIILDAGLVLLFVRSIEVTWVAFLFIAWKKYTVLVYFFIIYKPGLFFLMHIDKSINLYWWYGAILQCMDRSLTI